MPRLNIPATKINLIRIRGELALAREGYELLEQKRQVLLMEVMRLMDGLKKQRAEVERSLGEAYDRLRLAEVEAGGTRVALAALAAGRGREITIRERSVMGVVIPVASAVEEELRPSYSLADTDSAVDMAARAFHDALDHVAKLAGLENAALRLATELKKTQRRVNALSSFFIPQYRETLKYLQDTLEERDRDALFAMKLVKAKSEEEA